MIELAMEVPAAFARELTPLSDLDFVLAHKVLEDEQYAAFFAERTLGRELILDNSMHELGAPLPIRDLVHAVDLCNADFLIAPDVLCRTREDVQQNLRWFHECCESMHPAGNAVVLHGLTRQERNAYLRSVRGADMLCLPYREPRLIWYREQEDEILSNWDRIHLLGVSTPEELYSFAEIASVTPTVRWSVDTSKAVRWALQGRRIDDGGSLRGGSLTARDLLDVRELTDEARVLIAENVTFLRKFLVRNGVGA